MGRASGGPELGPPSVGTAQAKGVLRGPASQLAPSGGGRVPGLLGRNSRARPPGPGLRAQCSSRSPLGVAAAATSQDDSVGREGCEEVGGYGGQGRQESDLGLQHLAQGVGCGMVRWGGRGMALHTDGRRLPSEAPQR